MSKRKRQRDTRFPTPELWLPDRGLFLPSRPKRHRQFLGGGRQCCCACLCETCTCEISDSGFAPCCWKVVIAGMADITPTADCEDCATLNKTYFLEQTDDGSSSTPEGCSWFEGAVCGECDPEDIWLTAYEDGGDYIVEVTMGDHVWSKNYGESKPELCELIDETITHSVDSGDCDSSSATCVISRVCDGDACDTATCIGDCSDCDNPAEDLVIDIGSALVNEDCDACDTIAGEIVAEGVGACFWQFRQTDLCDALDCEDSVPPIAIVQVGFQLTVELRDLGGNDRGWRVELVFFKAPLSGQESYHWSSAAWNTVTDGSDCFFLADEEGKIDLSNFTSAISICQSNPDTDVRCSGLPATIQIWDANAP